MDRQPKVSVLINSYNYGRYLCEALDSVLSQDYRGEIECIVVDDGSTDDTPERIKPYLDKVRYIRQKNAGQPAAVNTGYRESSGSVIFFLDADDYWESNKISTVMEHYSLKPDLGLVNHLHVLTSEEGSYLNPEREEVDEPFVSSVTQKNGDGDLRELLMEQALPWVFNTTSTMSLPRWLCETVFPLNEELRINADTLFATAASVLAPIRFIEEPLGFYRLHGSNFWAQGADVSPEKLWAAELRNREAFSERFRFTESVLIKAGLPAYGFKTNWIYVKCRALAVRRPFILFLPEALSAIWRWEGPLREKLLRSYVVTIKSIDRTLRGKWK